MEFNPYIVGDHEDGFSLNFIDTDDIPEIGLICGYLRLTKFALL